MGDVIKAKIRKWFGDKGFGFARPEDAGRDRDRDVFVHARALDPSLQHLTRQDFPVMDSTGRPDFANSPPWPPLYVEAEMGDRGQRAVRVSDQAFNAGEPVSSQPSTAQPGVVVERTANYSGPRTAPRSQRGAPASEQRPRRGDKDGGGRRGSWGNHDDDF